LDPSNGQDGSRDQHHADGTGVVGADGIPIVVPDGPTQAQSLVQATRPAREIIGEWLPRLQAVRDAWATTLPAEAESEWPRGAAYVRESSINSLSGDAPDIQLRNVLALLTHRRVYVAPEGVFFDVQSGTDVGPRASFRRLFEQAAAIVAVGQGRADDLSGPAPALGLLERHKIDLTATSTRRDGEVIFKPNYRGRGDPFHLYGAAQVARVAADEQTDQQRYDG